MESGIAFILAAWTGLALAQQPGTAPSVSPGAPATLLVRPIGVVTEIKTGSLTLRTDAGPELQVPLPDGITVLRVPPGAKDLKAATPITIGDISLGDRVLIRGRVSDDQKSVVATSVIVMAKTELEKAREAERAEWQRRGIGGLVKALHADSKEITISVPNVPATPGNLTHPVVITLAANAVLLRYAPNSIKFSDARPSTFQEVKVGDQVRALGTKSEDGSRFVAEKLVSGTFRTLSATVVSVNAAPMEGSGATVTVKDFVSGQLVAVGTTADSRLHRLPPFLAQMIARFSSGGSAPQPQSGGPGAGRQEGQTPGGVPSRPEGGGSGAWRGNGPPDFQQILEHTPPLALSDLKPGDALIVLGTQGAKPTETTAITVLAGVEPILAAQPKGSEQMVLGPWNMSMSEAGQ